MVSLISLDRRRSLESGGERQRRRTRCTRSAFVACAAPVQASSDDPWSYRIWPFLSRVAGSGFKMALLGAFVLYVDQSACGGRAWIDRILHLRPTKAKA